MYKLADRSSSRSEGDSSQGPGTRKIRDSRPSREEEIGGVSGTLIQDKKKAKCTEKAKVQLASVHASLSNTIDIIDTFDRKGTAYADKKYAGSGTYRGGLENEPGKRIPKAGAFAEAGVGRACAAISVCEAEAKGPNASAGAEASVVGVGAMARAEIASASAKADPVAVKVGLGVDTGVSASLVDGVEAKFLGTGFSIGPKTGISVLGSEVSCAVM